MRTPTARVEWLANLQQHSFKNFHTKGLDYLCLQRTPEETIKVYFFEGDVSKAPEVVSPHDHRYRFDSECITGVLQNRLYFKDTDSFPFNKRYQRFDYHTPLNGGNGFTWAEEVSLELASTHTYDSGHRWASAHDEIHTLNIVMDQTILLLTQWEDEVPLDQPTSTYTLDVEPPSLDGLYEKFTMDEILARLKLLRGLFIHDALHSDWF